MRVLLSDGSGMTSRQVATHLARAGHEVHVLSADPLGLTRFTRHVRRVHRVPASGRDPFAWLERALAVLERHHFDALLPTHEQVAVLSAEAARVAATGVRTAIPSFESLRRLQDKIAAYLTLEELGLPQPETRIVRTMKELRDVDRFPVYVKTAIGTASSAVRYAEDRLGLERVADELVDEQFADGVLVQRALSGRLAMAQAVFSQGELVAWHTNVRVRPGAGGGAAVKCSINLPRARTDVASLGKALRWHGGISFDAILTDDGPRYIDVNPRLVEPGNAWNAGTDLAGALLRTAVDEPPEPSPSSASGCATHQLLVALLGAAQRSESRWPVVVEALAAIRGSGDFRDSTEELTPLNADWRASLPVLVVGLTLLIQPAAWRFFAANAVDAYALSREGWQAICAERATAATAEATPVTPSGLGSEERRDKVDPESSSQGIHAPGNAH